MQQQNRKFTIEQVRYQHQDH
jgi:hypothetical protein